MAGSTAREDVLGPKVRLVVGRDNRRASSVDGDKWCPDTKAPGLRRVPSMCEEWNTTSASSWRAAAGSAAPGEMPSPKPAASRCGRSFPSTAPYTLRWLGCARHVA